MGRSILRDKSYAFAIVIVRMAQGLQQQRKEYVLSKQLLRSGTAVGALLAEAEFGQSKTDFIHKLTIALKEANETNYWLALLKDTDHIDESNSVKVSDACSELVKMLVTSIKTARANLP